MPITLIMSLIHTVLSLSFAGAIIYLFMLFIKALRKYIKAQPAREERTEITKTLGEVLKQHRTECRMTQEFVAESIGVSRQAVSKWESGASSPSTSNLLMLAKLYGVSADELLRKTADKPE